MTLQTLIDTPVAPRDTAPHASVARREQLLATLRLARAVTADAEVDPDVPGAVVDFPTVVVVDGQPFDLEVTHRPGWFTEGDHSVMVHGTVGEHVVTGRFEVCVGESFGVAPASWQVKERLTDLYVEMPEHLRGQLPRSVEVGTQSYLGASRRAQVAAERARTALLVEQRGLLVTVLKRFRGVARTEGAVIESGDLMVVAEQQLLEVADRWFTNPERAPMRDVAWSKLVQRAVGNAVRSEIARATGISVEFRHLLGWFQRNPEDRSLPASDIARRMAFDAGVTRVMAQHGYRSRSQASTLLDAMLEEGTAQYVPPSREAAGVARSLRDEGVFVISSRSSIAEIERARHFRGNATLTIDGDDDTANPEAFLGVEDRGLQAAEAVDAVRSLIAAAGLSDIEAAVWVLRTGVLDPTGQGTELPDIAHELHLEGRAEARAALRRARRKLEQWVGTAEEISHSSLERHDLVPTRTAPGKDVRSDITRR